MFYTAVRVSELVHIEVGDVDLDACKIFINRGKGAKDRYILFPASFRLVLKSHLHATPRNRYLFETRRFRPFTTRRIQQIVQDYREKGPYGGEGQKTAIRVEVYLGGSGILARG